MELASKAFRDAVKGLFDGALPIVATVQSAREPFTDRLKRRADVARTPVLFLPHPVALGDGRGEIDSMAIAGRALTSGRFVWSHARFRRRLDRVENGLSSSLAEGDSLDSAPIRPRPNACLCSGIGSRVRSDNAICPFAGLLRE